MTKHTGHTSHSGGTNLTKDVIYVDVDDEITGIIDKLRLSDKKIVALVLPKRAAVLQSIVNMKLLKRAATEDKKNLVLITADAGLMPLAGSVGVHVAKSLNSRPEIPDAPVRAASESIETVEYGEAAIDSSKTVGELSGNPPTDEVEETIELDDEDDTPVTASAAASKTKKLKKFKIPNFNRFRIMLVLGAVGVLLFGMLGYAAIAVWPKAKITIKTDSTAINTSSVVTLKTGEDVKLDPAKGIVPAGIQEVKKTLKAAVPVTGQQNNGAKAEGSVSMTAKKCGGNPFEVPSPVPAGSGISTGGNTYITQEKTTFVGTGSSGGCYDYSGTGNTAIVAQTGGSKFNITSATFTVAGRSDVTATGSASGGTDEIVKVVSQVDIDNAKKKISEGETEAVQQELKAALIGRGLFAVDATFNVGKTETKLSAEVNTEAEKVEVTQTITYSMLGAKQEDLEKVIEVFVATKIDIKKQTILNYGLDNATFGLQGVNKDGASVSLQTTAVAGAELNVATIKKQVAGKKAGAARELILANPGVTAVEVEYSPFWVSSIPKDTSKITVTVQEPKVTPENAPAP